MAGPRSKRKRPSNDPTTSRRRTRDTSGSGVEPASKPQKNEEPSSSKSDVKDATTLTENKAAEIPLTTETEASNGPMQQEAVKSKSESAPNPAEDNNVVEGDASVEQAPTDNASEKDNQSSTPSKSEKSRQEIIKGLLSHRKLLLERVRQTRSAARDQLEVLLKSKPTVASLTDEQEVALFEKSTKDVISLARKQARTVETDTTGEKRTTSVSLRRGSGVGKRMNAALSSLAPGGGVATFDTDVLPTTSQPPPAARKALPSASQRPPPAAAAVPTAPPVPRPSSATVASARAPAAAPAALASAVLKAPPPTAAPSRPVLPKSLKTSMAGSRGMPSAATLPSASTTTALHAGLGGTAGGLPPNRLAHPSVVCVEARSLRERRNSIRNRLASLMKERQERIDRTGRDRSGTRGEIGSFASSSSTPSSPSRLSRFEREFAIRGPGRPSHLPRRRRTHWDYLLEEMRWTATDFIEERKWKVSAARALSEAILSPEEPTVSSQPADKGPDAVMEDSAKPSEADDDLKSAASVSETKQDKVQAEPTANVDSGLRPYEEVSAEDEVAVKKVAKIVASMISELSATVMEVGAFAQSDDGYLKALERHQHVRKQLEGNESPAPMDVDAKEKKEAKSSKEGGPDSKKNGETSPQHSETAHDENEEPTDPSERHKTFERMTDYVDSLLEKVVKSGVKSKTVSVSKKTQELKLTLSTEQARAVEAVEHHWTAVEAGVVLKGPISTGKTISACTLLWKHRSGGPQMVVCSSASMIRWVHELHRFDDLEIHSLGFTGGISNPVLVKPSKRTFEAGDVLLCEYSTVTKVPKQVLEVLHSVVVDCRHPGGYFGSRWPVCTEKLDSSSAVKSSKTMDVANELKSTSWWAVLAATSRSSVNRLLIDCVSPADTLLPLRGLSDRQLLEVLALRVAFVYDASVFRLPRYSTQKTVLAWARKRIKDSKETGSKFERVKNLLLRMIEPFYYDVGGAKCLEEITSLSNSMHWELRKCSMASRQRTAYERSCAELRAALNTVVDHDGEERSSYSDHYGDVADALLRLRYQCIHEDIDRILASSLVRTRLGSFPLGRSHLAGDSGLDAFPRKPADSTSQPDLELACRIVNGSSKLQELVAVLCDDCQCSAVLVERLRQVLHRARKKLQSKGKQKKAAAKACKVAILAVLPEVQVLVSVLLSSMGMTHELFLRTISSAPDSDASERDAQLGSLAWARCQLALSKFNAWSGESEDSLMPVIIASPEAVAGDHGGLGIEAADIVICLDEDWSGRGELTLDALVARCRFCTMSAKEGGCSLVKLITADTCEDRFLSPGKMGRARHSPEESSSPNVWPWPLNPFGLFMYPTSTRADAKRLIRECWSSRGPSPESFAFPGRNILQFRGRDLSEVLATSQSLAPLLGSPSKLVFLPPSNSNSSVEVEMNFMRSLVKREEQVDPFMSGVVARGLVPTVVSVLPPLAIDFPKDLIPREDLTVMPTRLHLYRFGKAFDLHGASLAAPPELSTNGTVPVDDSAELLDQWQSVSPSDKPNEFASALLFYGTSELSPSMVPGSTSSTQRINAYSESFSCGREVEVRDGNQGSEALVYFPPLFPRMLESSILATEDVQALRSSLNVANPNKRSGDSVPLPESKRPRLEEGAAANVSVQGSEPAPANGATPSVPSAEDHPMRSPPVITEDEATHSDAASVLLDLTDDYGLAGIGAVPLPRDSALAAAHSFVDASGLVWDRASSGSEWLSLVTPCDAEEAESTYQPDLTGVDVGSMILFVSRKRPRGYAGLPSAASLPQRPRGPWPGTAMPPSGGNGVVYDVAGAMSGKKMKKKGASQKDHLGSSAFSRLPGLDQPVVARPLGQVPLHYPKTKDGYKHRVLNASRQAAIGSTLFEAPNFRFAAVRVRTRVAGRLARHCWTSSTAFEVGPGLPLLVSKQHSSVHGYRGLFEADPNLWTSIVKRLKNKESTTGDEATELAMAQRASLRRSLNAPCRVDFGPFQGGFMSSPTGMTAVAPPRSRMGVTLPMGVKVPQTIKDSHQLTWSEGDDSKLRQCTSRYGMNWMMVSRVLSGFQDIVIFSQRDSSRHSYPRAARSVRDRWQTLARSEPAFAKELREHERTQRDRSLMKISEIPDASDTGRRIPSIEPNEEKEDSNARVKKESIVFLVPSSENDAVADDKNGKTPEGDSKPTAKSRATKRTFAAVDLAKTKKQTIPMTIPGVTSGSPPSVRPSHPSHMQSVQSSIAASWSNGRTEMWPIQLLEAADRQRSAAAAATAPPRPSSSSSRHASSSATGKSSRLPPNSAPMSSHHHHGSTRPPNNSFPSAPPNNTSSGPRGSSSSSRPPQNWAPPPSSSTMQNFAPPPTTKTNGPSNKSPSSSNSDKKK